MSWEASQAAQADCFALCVVWFVEGTLLQWLQVLDDGN